MYRKPNKYEGVKVGFVSHAKLKKIFINLDYGWGGRIRTYGTRDQNPMPYHLATPH